MSPQFTLTYSYHFPHRNQPVWEPWENRGWHNPKDEQQQPVSVQAAASRGEGAVPAGSVPFPGPRRLQQGRATGPGDEGPPGVPSALLQPAGVLLQPAGEPARGRRRQGKVLPGGAALVVRVCRLDPGDCDQWRVGLLHHDVRADLREGPLHQLAHLHGGVLCGESVHHPTSEGATQIQIKYLYIYKNIILKYQYRERNGIYYLILILNYWFLQYCRKCNIIFLQKVLGFAAFFALVLKKVDQEDYGEPQVEDTLRTSGMFVVKLVKTWYCFYWNPLGAIYNVQIHLFLKKILSGLQTYWMCLLCPSVTSY